MKYMKTSLLLGSVAVGAIGLLVFAHVLNSAFDKEQAQNKDKENNDQQ